jgi:hypothetical protein
VLYASEAGLLDDISKGAMGRPLQEIIDKMTLTMDMDEEPTWYNFIFDKSVHYDYIGKPNPRLSSVYRIICDFLPTPWIAQNFSNQSAQVNRNHLSSFNVSPIHRTCKTPIRRNIQD